MLKRPRQISILGYVEQLVENLLRAMLKHFAVCVWKKLAKEQVRNARKIFD